MDTFWLKVAGIAVLGLIVLGLGAKFFGGSGDTSPSERTVAPAETKSFARQVEEDRERLSVELKPVDPPAQKPRVPPVPAAATDVPTEQAEEVSRPTIIYVKPMEYFEQVEAERLWNTAVPGRSIGRLPMTGYSLAVKGCSEIIQRWPDSEYAFRAMRLLNDIPENRRGRVRNEDIDMSRFYQERPGTKAMKVEEPR